MRKIIYGLKNFFDVIYHSGIDANDIIFIAGLVILAYGMALIYIPIAYITVGVVLLSISFPRVPGGPGGSGE